MQDIFFEWSPFDFTFHYLCGIFFKMQLFFTTLTHCPVFGDHYTLMDAPTFVLGHRFDLGC